MQRERAEAANTGASDRAAGSADPAAPTEANFGAGVPSMTAGATAPTEAKAEVVGPVMRLDIAAPTEANPEAPLPCEAVGAVAPSEADAEQEVLFVSAEAAAPTGPDAGFEIARGGRHVVETPVLGPTFWSGGMLHRPLSDASGVWNSGLANTFEPLVRFGSFTQPAHRMEACQDGVIPEGWPSLGRV